MDSTTQADHSYKRKNVLHVLSAISFAIGIISVLWFLSGSASERISLKESIRDLGPKALVGEMLLAERSGRALSVLRDFESWNAMHEEGIVFMSLDPPVRASSVSGRSITVRALGVESHYTTGFIAITDDWDIEVLQSSREDVRSLIRSHCTTQAIDHAPNLPDWIR
jgi:hypothetical protein